mmetsp:Transcript_19595/g.54584  ORF Transcript_19595/g.54584 Transcript_19595/m.54584 type:complete len:154 (-) Transcript_19595:1531-1992(-)
MKAKKIQRIPACSKSATKEACKNGFIPSNSVLKIHCAHSKQQKDWSRGWSACVWEAPSGQFDAASEFETSILHLARRCLAWRMFPWLKSLTNQTQNPMYREHWMFKHTCWWWEHTPRSSQCAVIQSKVPLSGMLVSALMQKQHCKKQPLCTHM